MTSDITKAGDGKPLATIYFNPRCGTAKKVLGYIRDAGIEPEIIEYLKTPPTKAKLKSLLKAMKIPPRELVRAKQKEFKEAGLDDPSLSDERIIDAMIEQPILINRPIVVTAKGAKLCRPAEGVHDLLP